MHCAQCGIDIAIEDNFCFSCGARKQIEYVEQIENNL